MEQRLVFIGGVVIDPTGTNLCGEKAFRINKKNLVIINSKVWKLANDCALARLCVNPMGSSIL